MVDDKEIAPNRRKKKKAKGKRMKQEEAPHQQVYIRPIVRIGAGVRNSTPDRLQEIHTLRALEHPRVVYIHGVGMLDGQLVMIFDCPPNQTLREVLKGIGKKLSYQSVLTLAEQIADGMAYLERKGVVHRQLSLDTVCIDEQGQAQVTPPALSWELLPQLLHVGGQAGKTWPLHLQYSAPELLRGEPHTSNTDLWAFGVLLLELNLNGESVWGAATQEAIAERVTIGQLPYPPQLPSQLCNLVQACTLYYPYRRVPSFKRVWRWLQKIQEGVDPDPTLLQPRPMEKPPEPTHAPGHAGLGGAFAHSGRADGALQDTGLMASLWGFLKRRAASWNNKQENPRQFNPLRLMHRRTDVLQLKGRIISNQLSLPSFRGKHHLAVHKELPNLFVHDRRNDPNVVPGLGIVASTNLLGILLHTFPPCTPSPPLPPAHHCMASTTLWCHSCLQQRHGSSTGQGHSR